MPGPPHSSQPMSRVLARGAAQIGAGRRGGLQPIANSNTGDGNATASMSMVANPEPTTGSTGYSPGKSPLPQKALKEIRELKDPKVINRYMGIYGGSIADRVEPRGGGGLFEWMYSLGGYKGGTPGVFSNRPSVAQLKMIRLMPLHTQFKWLLHPDTVIPIGDARRMAIMRARFEKDPNSISPLKPGVMQNAANVALANAPRGSQYYGTVSSAIQEARIVNQLMGQMQRRLQHERNQRNAATVKSMGGTATGRYLMDSRGRPITAGGKLVGTGRP